MLTRRIKLQLALFSTVAVVAGAIMAFGYVNVPAMLGIGRYTVTVQLPQAAGLYRTGNVVYRGTAVGRVSDVRLTDNGGGGGAVAELRSGHSVRPDCGSAQHLGDRRAVCRPGAEELPTPRR